MCDTSSFLVCQRNLLFYHACVAAVVISSVLVSYNFPKKIKDVSLMLTLQVNLGMYVADGKYELSILVDRAVGASSIQDGQIEIMLHRY